MVLEEKLKYLTRCRCLACTERSEIKEKSLEQLHLDSIFASMKEKLITHVFEQIHGAHQKLTEEFTERFIKIVEQKAEEVCHEAFDASCEYGFAKDRAEGIRKTK